MYVRSNGGAQTHTHVWGCDRPWAVLRCVVNQAFETQREYLLYQRVSAVGVVFLAKLKLRSSDLSFLQSVRPPSPRLKVLSHN